MRNEHAAPTFDSSKPRELSRNFEDLEQLMRQAAIALEEEKKQQVLCYVDFNTEQIWKTFPEFIDNKRTYNDFKAAILVHYPVASGDFVYSIRDMDLLIGNDNAWVLPLPKTSPIITYNSWQSLHGLSAKDSLVTYNNNKSISKLSNHPYSMQL